MGGLSAEKVTRWYTQARNATREWRDEARESYDLVAGWQWTTSEEGALKEKKRLPVVMNRIAPYVDSILGQQVNNRQEIKFLPRSDDDGGISELYTEAIRWADDLCNAEDEISDAFGDMLIAGMGVTECRMDYASDPEGLLITAERVDPLELYWDTNATKRNLTDATWIMRARLMPADEAEMRWPEIENIDPGQLTGEDETHTTPHDATEAPWYRGTNRGREAEVKEYLVLQCQYYRDEPVYRVADPESGQLVTFTPSKFGKMRDVLDQMGVKYAKGTERKFYQCWVAGNTVLEQGPAPSQVGFTLKVMCGKRDRNRRQWYGIVRSLKDPQKFSNKFFSDFLAILASNRKGGAFVEIDALVDPRKAEQDWNSPDALIRLNPGGIAKIRERDAGIFPTGLDRLLQYAIDAVPSVSGMSAELMGMADRQQAGVLEAQRKQSSLTILAPLFDALRRYMKERGTVLLDMVREYIADGRLIRIVGEEGAQYVPLIRADGASKYDIVVDQAATTQNSKEQTFQVLTQLLPFAAKMGLPIPPDAIKYLPLPESLTQKWLEMLQPKEGPQEPSPEQQAEMAKAQLEREKAQIQMQLKQMDAQAKQQQTQLTMAQQQQEAALKEREMLINAKLKEQEFLLKQLELQQRERELMSTERTSEIQLEMKREEGQQRMSQEAERGDEIREHFTELLRAIQDTQGKNAQALGNSLRTMAELMTAEKEAVKDDRGRLSGTRIKREALEAIMESAAPELMPVVEALSAEREVIRDGNGRAAGTRKRTKK